MSYLVKLSWRDCLAQALLPNFLHCTKPPVKRFLSVRTLAYFCLQAIYAILICLDSLSSCMYTCRRREVFLFLAADVGSFGERRTRSYEKHGRGEKGQKKNLNNKETSVVVFYYLSLIPSSFSQL